MEKTDTIHQSTAEFQGVRNYKWWCVSKVERSYCAWWSVGNAKWNQISLEKLFVTFWITEQHRLLWLLSKPIKRLKLTSIFKGTVYSELKILLTHHHFIPNLYDFLAFKEMFSSMFIQFLRYPWQCSDDPEWALEPIFTCIASYLRQSSILLTAS